MTHLIIWTFGKLFAFNFYGLFNTLPILANIKIRTGIIVITFWVIAPAKYAQAFTIFRRIGTNTFTSFRRIRTIMNTFRIIWTAVIVWWICIWTVFLLKTTRITYGVGTNVINTHFKLVTV
jgi:hypothetical protein